MSRPSASTTVGEEVMADYSHTKIEKHGIEVTELGKVAMVLFTFNGKVRWEFFIDIDDWHAMEKKRNKRALLEGRDLKRYHQYMDEFWVKYNEHGMHSEQFYPETFQHAASWLFSQDRIDPSKMYSFCRDDHTIWKLGADVPISPVTHCDYIGGVCNDEFRLRKAKEILDDSKYTWDVKVVDIPYYNQGENHTRAIEFFFRLPTVTANKIWRFLMKEKEEKGYWTLNFKDAVVKNYAPYDKFDPLKLNVARRKEPIEEDDL
jgi:hypothetical protein